jgi:predicted transcriptional regulator
LKKEGYADSTLKAYDSRLRGLARHVDNDNPEAVKAYIAIDRLEIMFLLEKRAKEVSLSSCAGESIGTFDVQCLC